VGNTLLRPGDPGVYNCQRPLAEGGFDDENLGMGSVGGAGAGIDVVVVRSAAQGRSRDTVGTWLLVYWPWRASPFVGCGNRHLESVALSAGQRLGPGHAHRDRQCGTENQRCPGSPASPQAG